MGSDEIDTAIAAMGRREEWPYPLGMDIATRDALLSTVRAVYPAAEDATRYAVAKQRADLDDRPLVRTVDQGIEILTDMTVLDYAADNGWEEHRLGRHGYVTGVTWRFRYNSPLALQPNMRGHVWVRAVHVISPLLIPVTSV